MNPLALTGPAVTLMTVAAGRALDRAVFAAPFPVCAAYFTVRETSRELWRDLPGPRWLKIALVILAVCEPGPFGEWALTFYVLACRRARRYLAARRTARSLLGELA